jgi:hypothetical protein
MGEHQYYEFRALDRPLDDEDQRVLLAISSRAEITARRLTNSRGLVGVGLPHTTKEGPHALLGVGEPHLSQCSPGIMRYLARNTRGGVIGRSRNRLAWYMCRSFPSTITHQPGPTWE